MSKDAGAYYGYAGRSSSQRHLPPIRDVVGDVLDQPVRPRPKPDTDLPTPRRQTYPTSTRHMRDIHCSEQQPHPAVQLPPIRSRSASAIPSSVATASCLPRGSRRTHPQSEIPRTQPQRPELRSSSHSFDVFVASGQGLVHQRTSTKDDFRQSSKEDAISASTGKFICPHCGRRFEKSSHFKSHLISHSGEKPYECPQCGKAFSASSNMRRHQRTHGTVRDSSDL